MYAVKRNQSMLWRKKVCCKEKIYAVINLECMLKWLLCLLWWAHISVCINSNDLCHDIPCCALLKFCLNNIAAHHSVLQVCSLKLERCSRLPQLLHTVAYRVTGNHIVHSASNVSLVQRTIIFPSDLFLIICMLHHFFPRVILLCLYRGPQPKKTQKAPHHRPQTSSTENPNPKTQCKTPTPKPQTTINEPK